MHQKIAGALILFVAQLLLLHGAQAFPDRPIKWVVSSPAGGPPDIMARLLSDKLAAVLGQPVVIENRTGGASGSCLSACLPGVALKEPAAWLISERSLI